MTLTYFFSKILKPTACLKTEIIITFVNFLFKQSFMHSPVVPSFSLLKKKKKIET